jgi:hypothetical protein
MTIVHREGHAHEDGVDEPGQQQEADQQGPERRKDLHSGRILAEIIGT